MRIESIALNNIRSYSNFKLNFRQGINFISGENGAGKTTIIEAIGYALFGSAPSNSNNYFLRYGEKKASITVEFSIGGEMFTVTKKIGSASSHRLYQDGQELDLHGTVDVESFIKERLAMSPADSMSKVFETIVGIRQGEFTAPFLRAPGDRKKIFDAVLNVESYREAFEKGAPLKRLIEQKTAQITEQRARQEGITLGLPQKQEELSRLEEALAQSLQELKITQIELEQAQSRLDQCVNERIQLNKAAAAEQEMLARLNVIERDAANKYADIEKSKAADSLLNANAQGHKAYVTAQESAAAIETKRTQRDQLAATAQSVELECSVRVSKIEGLLGIKCAEGELMQRLEGMAEANKEAIRKNEAEYERLCAAGQKLKAQSELIDMLSATAKQLEAKVCLLKEFEKRIQELKTQLEAENGLKAKLVELTELEAEFAKSNDIFAGLSREQDYLQNSQIKATGGLCPMAGDACPKTQTVCEGIKSRLCEIAAKLRELNSANNDLRARIDSMPHVRSDLTKLDGVRAFIIKEDNEYSKIEREINGILAGKCKLLGIADGNPANSAEQNASIWLNAFNALQSEFPHANEAYQQDKSVFLESKKTTENTSRALEAAMQNARDLPDIQAKREDLRRGLLEYADLGEDISAVNRLLEENELAYKTYIQNENAAKQLQALESEYVQLLKNMEQARSKYDSAKATSDELKAKNDETAERTAQQHLAAITGKHSAATKTYNLLSKEMERGRSEVAMLLMEKEKLEDLDNQLKKMDDIDKTTKLCLSVLNEAGGKVALALRGTISEAASAVYANISRENARLNWESDYDVTLRDVHGGKPRVRGFSQLSGGEQMTAALAIRLVLLRQSKLRLAFFDEPTTNLDAGRRMLFLEALQSTAADFEQIFVVSHDDTFDSLTDNIIALSRSSAGTIVKTG